MTPLPHLFSNIYVQNRILLTLITLGLFMFLAKMATVTHNQRNYLQWASAHGDSAGATRSTTQRVNRYVTDLLHAPDGTTPPTLTRGLLNR